MLKIPTFRNLEKEKYLKLKSGLFSKEAQAKGTYGPHQYDFCLADGHSDENLHSSLVFHKQLYNERACQE
jgi:hypothetical protein